MTEPNIIPDVGKRIHCGNRELIIHDLPQEQLAALSRHDLENLTLVGIIHQVMHLYANGDRAGKTAIASKLEHGRPLETNGMRMHVGYIVSRPEIEDELVLQIYFSPNYSETGQPVQLVSAPRQEFSSRQVNILRKLGLVNHTTRTEIFFRKPMPVEEAGEHFEAFVHTCYEEIKAYLQRVHDEAVKNGTEPNYLTVTKKQ